MRFAYIQPSHKIQVINWTAQELLSAFTDFSETNFSEEKQNRRKKKKLSWKIIPGVALTDSWACDFWTLDNRDKSSLPLFNFQIWQESKNNISAQKFVGSNSPYLSESFEFEKNFSEKKKIARVFQLMH